MAKKELNYKQKFWVSEVSAYLVSAGIPVATALAMFPPELVEETGVSVGLSVIIVAIMAVAVLRNRLKNIVTGDVGIANAYLILFAIALLLDYIAKQVKVIAIVGAAANYGSIPLFNAANHAKEMDEKLKQAKEEKEIEQKVECV